MVFSIKQIFIFQLRVLRMAVFLEFMLQVKNIVMAFRNSGEPGVSQLPEKVEAAYIPFVNSVSKMDSTYKLMPCLLARWGSGRSVSRTWIRMR